MEEVLDHPILTLTLSPAFNQYQWRQLTRDGALVFQKQMLAISQLLEQHLPSLTTKYYKFVQNHLTLGHWHAQNEQLRALVGPYLFNPQAKWSRRPYHAVTKSQGAPRQHHSVRKQFAQHLGTSALGQHLQVEPLDHYQLYMQTFSACRGKRYSPYDYDKHMKSSGERNKYNNFIRVAHGRNLSGAVVHQKQHQLEHFQEWKASHNQKASLVTIRTVLSDVSLNNEKGINRLLKKQGSNKLVLLNHQRKPINYYLRARTSK